MFKRMLGGKIHRATVTACELNYEGSCAIDKLLLDAAGIEAFEEIEVWNVTNGERFATYAIEAPAGSGTISLNGSAARRASVGDVVIIATFTLVPADKTKEHRPFGVFVHPDNSIRSRDDLRARHASGEPVVESALR